MEELLFSNNQQNPFPSISDDRGSYDLFSWLLRKERSIFILNNITRLSMQYVIAQIFYLTKLDESKEIKIFINSPGGDVDAANALYDITQLIPTPITTICTGLAASAGSYILTCCGTKGMRYATLNSSIMFHQPSFTFGEGMSLNQVDMNIYNKRLSMMRENLEKNLSKHMSIPYEEICKLTDRDSWLTSQEAVDIGAIDNIWNRN